MDLKELIGKKYTEVNKFDNQVMVNTIVSIDKDDDGSKYWLTLEDGCQQAFSLDDLNTLAKGERIVDSANGIDFYMEPIVPSAWLSQEEVDFIVSRMECELTWCVDGCRDVYTDRQEEIIRSIISKFKS